MSVSTAQIRVRVLPAFMPINGRELEIRLTDEFLQSRYVGDADWTNIAPIADITGPIGPETEFQSNGSFIQYRPAGSVDWTDLVSLADISGPAPGLASGVITTLPAGSAATFGLRLVGPGSYEVDAGIPAGPDGADMFPSIAAAQAFVPTATPAYVDVAGYRSPVDDGGALYVNPVTVNPGKTDQIVQTIGGTPTYYNRLHDAGEVDFAKHGLYLDGREENALFQDTFAVALDRGLKKLVMPGGKTLKLVRASIPAGSFDVDFRRSRVLGDFNSVIPGATAGILRAMNGPTGTIGNMTANGGLAAPFVRAGSRSRRSKAQAARRAATSGWCGQSFATARTIKQAMVWGTMDYGYAGITGQTITLDLYAKAGAAPASDTDGTLLGTISFTDAGEIILNATPDPDVTGVAYRVIPSSNKTTKYNHFWIKSANPAVADMVLGSISFSLGAVDDELLIRGLVMDGQYNPAVTLTDEERIFDIEGYRKFTISDFTLSNCGRSTPSPYPVDPVIFERSDRAININNCLEAIAERGTLVGNAKFEEIIIQSDFPDCLAIIRECNAYGHISSGTPYSVLNGAPGSQVVSNRAEGGYTGSGTNFLTKHGKVSYNWFRGISSSSGIDCHEGLFYADGTEVSCNFLENCESRGVFIGGSGTRITGNVANNCTHGFCIETAISPVAAIYGPWLQTTEHSLAGNVVQGNRSLGHNFDGGTNADYRFFGTSTSPMQVKVIGADGEVPAIKSEYGVWGRYVTIEASGRFMHGRGGLFVVDEGDNELILTDCTMDCEPTQGVDCVLLIGGTLTLHWGKGTKRTGTLDASYFDIARRSAGTVTSIDIDPSCATPTMSVPANSRVTKGSRIQARRSVAHATIAAGSRDIIVVPVPGARTSDEVIASIVSSTALFIADAWVSSDNNVTVEVQNETASSVTASSVNMRIATMAAGYDVS